MTIKHKFILKEFNSIYNSGCYGTLNFAKNIATICINKLFEKRDDLIITIVIHELIHDTFYNMYKLKILNRNERWRCDIAHDELPITKFSAHNIKVHNYYIKQINKATL